MKRLLVLGAGTAGTIFANRMRKHLPDRWTISVVDGDPVHVYQPGLLFLPLGAHDEHRITRPRARTLDVEWVREEVFRVDADKKQVTLLDDTVLSYDVLVIASGARPRPDLVRGLVGEDWHRDAFDFFTLGGAQALRHAIARFHAGRFVVQIVEPPVKAPFAALELCFLADELFRKRGTRKDIEITLTTAYPATFEWPLAAQTFGRLLEARDIHVQTSVFTKEIDRDARVIRTIEGRELPYDLLVAIPPHSGAAFIERSGIGDDLAFVPTDPKTLGAKHLHEVFVLGDATDLDVPKVGSVAHYQAELLVENLVRHLHKKPLLGSYEGHASYFVETGGGKALLVDYDHDHEPHVGYFPTGVGPIPMLQESRLAHYGKRAFRFLYWSGLLPGRPFPVGAQPLGKPSVPIF
ncbi:MAG: FAD-dependent oxidoreductase [Myxococcales bacterium]|nr:FAD-dependent oxidoreductase [Myxococcales bacterium]